MQLRFTKMHGLGNDFMVVELLTQEAELAPEQIAALGDRHTGVGFDQLLMLLPPEHPDADFRYRIFNADGSEAQQCGNGLRCLARFIADQALSPKQRLELEAPLGRVWTHRHDADQIEVGMGVPSTDPERIPFLTDCAALAYPLSIDGAQVTLTPVSIGNPHAVIFVDDLLTADVAGIGAGLARHERFPEGVNAGFCQIVDPGFLRLRVFERGVGETRACGSAACAAVVAGRLHGRLSERVKVSLPGGKLRVAWAGPGEELTLTGPACRVYDGRIEL